MCSFFDRSIAAACGTRFPVWCAYFLLLVDSHTRSNKWEFLTSIFEQYVKVHGSFIENSKWQSRHTSNFLLLTDGNNMPTHTRRGRENLEYIFGPSPLSSAKKSHWENELTWYSLSVSYTLSHTSPRCSCSRTVGRRYSVARKKRIECQ